MNRNTMRTTAQFRRLSHAIESNIEEASMTSPDVVTSRREELETVAAWTRLGVKEVPLLALWSCPSCRNRLSYPWPWPVGVVGIYRSISRRGGLRLAVRLALIYLSQFLRKKSSKTVVVIKGFRLGILYYFWSNGVLRGCCGYLNGWGITLTGSRSYSNLKTVRGFFEGLISDADSYRSIVGADKMNEYN